MTSITSRRAVLAGAAALPAVAIAPAATLAIHEPDPIFPALANYHGAMDEFSRLWEELEDAERDAECDLGRCPIELIRWRNYSHIGGGEIDRVRNEFLSHGVAPANVIEAEYIDARRRWRERRRDVAQWYREAGLRQLYRDRERARYGTHSTMAVLERTKPTTVAGAAALAAFMANDVEIGPAKHQASMLRNLSEALAAQS